MRYGTLTFKSALEAPELLAEPVRNYLHTQKMPQDVWVSPIDASLADTAAFCEAYEIGLEVSANCVVVEAKRGERVWYAACIILATARVDVNGTVRKLLDARKVSFAPMEVATSLTAMEYGGITPIGLPTGWSIFVDDQVMKQEKIIIGSGIRSSKILTTPDVLKSLAHARVVAISKNQ
jgi:prolyl-tRNA editing enzyme YbaK/EbsC (Cys-tRNA(Pro) deacylase)